MHSSTINVSSVCLRPFLESKNFTNVEELIKPKSAIRKAKHGHGIRDMKSSFLM